MRVFLTFICLVLSSCSQGSVEVWGGSSKRISEGGFQFTVKYTREKAEAFRVNPVLRPDADLIFAAAVAAMTRASGCTVVRRSVDGDVARITAKLRC